MPLRTALVVLTAMLAAAAEPARPAGNLLANPGFDAGGGGWFLQSWQPFRPGVPARCAESPHSGRWALRLAAGGASVVSACTAWILGCSDAGSGFAWLDLAPAGRFVGAANATSGLDPLPLVDWRRSAGGWGCRASFPPAALPQIALRPGHVLGLSLLINDDDGQGRKQGLTLGPAGSEPHGRPWLWKRCQLAP